MGGARKKDNPLSEAGVVSCHERKENERPKLRILISKDFREKGKQEEKEHQITS